MRLSGRLRRLAAVAAVAFVVSSSADAAVPTALTWDADPATPGIQDGPGTWDTTLSTFYGRATAGNYAYDNTANHDVTLGNGGPGDSVTLGTSVTAHSLTFDPATSPYTIAANAGAALTLATTTPSITTNADVTISAPIVIPYPTQPPVIFSKNGTGRLTLSGTNAWDGGRTWFEINAGSVLATSPDSLPGYTSMKSIRVNGSASLYVPVGGESQWTSAALDSLGLRTRISGDSVFGIDTTAADFTYGGGLSGGKNVKIGLNTLTLTGVGGGNFVVAEGAAVISPRPNASLGLSSVTLSPDTTLTVGSGGTVTMTSVGLAAGSRLNVNGYAQIANVTLPSNAAVAVNADARLTTVSLAPGGTLSIAPGATAQLASPNNGGNTPAVLTTTTPDSTVAVTGGGILSSPGPLTFGPVSGVTYDLTALSAFTLTGRSVTTINGQQATVKLPPTARLSAGSLNVGVGTAVPSDVHSPTLLLGKTTSFDVGGLQVGVVGDVGTGSADGVVKLAAGTTDATVTIRSSTASNGRVYLNVGSGNAPTKIQSALLDVRGATLDATVARMIVGSYRPGGSNNAGPATGGQTSRFAMCDGVLDASEIAIGISAMPSSINGALTTAGTNVAAFVQDGGTVRAGTMTLGTFTNSDSLRIPAGTLTATYDLGTATSEATLAAGAINAIFRGYAGYSPMTKLTTARTINFNNGRITTATATSDLTIRGVTGSAAPLLTAASRNVNIVLAATGTHALTAPLGRSITLTDTAVLAGDGGLLIDGPGTVTLNGNNTYTGVTTVTAGTLELAASAHAPVLTNAGGADIRDGRIKFAYAADNPASTLRDVLASSFADALTPGVMDSGRIRSSAATVSRGLGYADDGSAMTVKAALFGDADLDGGVSINDFNTMAINFGQSVGKVWTDGDFDYDGGVSINDFNLLAGGFGQSLPPTSQAWAGLLAFAAANNDLVAFEAVTGVPEPASVALLTACATLGLNRRVRQSITPSR